jgi:excisionase family DNA binding protein
MPTHNVHAQAMLSVEEVAKRLAVPVSWVYAQASRGRMPAIKIGKYWRFDPAEITDWLARHSNGRRGVGPSVLSRNADEGRK